MSKIMVAAQLPVHASVIICDALQSLANQSISSLM